MSNESKEIELIKDPGLPAHQHRRTDVDEKYAKIAERQVAILFMLSVAGTLLLIYSYIFIDTETFIFIPIFGDQNAHQLFLGLGMAMALFFIGAGAIHWAKQLMSDEEVIAQRHEFRSDEVDRAEFVKSVKEGAAVAGLGRRPLIKRTLGLALGLSGLTPLLLLRDLGPLPGNEQKETSWKAGTRLVTDPGDIAKDAVLLIRLRPEDFNLDDERLSWTHEGIIAFSKICSHMGCAVALYEQQTKHLLCPCHQSTFDVTRAAKVIFGPAARPLPQLAVTVDSEGYLIAQAPFNEPVGPSFWGRSA
jgi:ubiquinol-cytochrome c reductase iron-sulfur subunit